MICGSKTGKVKPRSREAAAAYAMFLPTFAPRLEHQPLVTMYSLLHEPRNISSYVANMASKP